MSNPGYTEQGIFYNVQSSTCIYGNLTCQSNVLRYLSVLRPAYSDLCHTEHSSNQHRMDGYPEKENKFDDEDDNNINIVFINTKFSKEFLTKTSGDETCTCPICHPKSQFF